MKIPITPPTTAKNPFDRFFIDAPARGTLRIDIATKVNGKLIFSIKRGIFTGSTASILFWLRCFNSPLIDKVAGGDTNLQIVLWLKNCPKPRSPIVLSVTRRSRKVVSFMSKRTHVPSS